MITTLLKKLTTQFRKEGPIGGARYVIRGLRERSREFFDDTLFDWRYGTETSLIETEGLSRRGHERSEDFNPYEAIKWRHFRRMLDYIQESSLQDFTFIDIGCGKGRALLFASKAGFRKIMGVELSPRLADVATKNIASFKAKTRTVSDLSVINCEAGQYSLPTAKLVIFLYNPFGGETMRALLANIADLRCREQKAIYILYRNPLCHDMLATDDAFRTIVKNRTFAVYHVDAPPK